MPFKADDARTTPQIFVTPKLEKAGSSGMLLASARLTRSPRHGVICPSSDTQGPPQRDGPASSPDLGKSVVSTCDDPYARVFIIEDTDRVDEETE